LLEEKKLKLKSRIPTKMDLWQQFDLYFIVDQFIITPSYKL